MHVHGYFCLPAQAGGLTVPDRISSGWCCIDASHARKRGEGETENKRSTLTCDVHVHDAGASPDAVGGVAHVRAGHVIGHGALEEQGVVFDFHISGQRAVQTAEREEERKGDDMDTV